MMTIESLYKVYVEHPTVTTDSRVCPNDSIFFALKGENFNGNNYAAKALEQGCSYAVVDEEQPVKDARYILVDDVLKTLQALARYHREMLRVPIIGITGTNGKTTTKELVATVLSKKYNVLYTQGNLNNHIGVPLTLLRLKADHQLAIIEMGASHPGDIAELTAIAEPDYGLITNVGKAHLAGFGSLQGVMQTKGELYDFVKQHKGQLYVNSGNEQLLTMLGGYPAMRYALNNREADVTGHVTENNPYITLHWRYAGESHGVKTHFIGEYNAENMLAAITIGHSFNVEPTMIETALAEYVPQNNRSQMLQTDRNSIVVDAYNANPTSMNAALSNFQNMEMPNKLVILGDMLELGEQSSEEHAQVVKKLKTMPEIEVILVGHEFSSVAEGFTHYEKVDELIAKLKEKPLEHKTILVKGSHGIALEKCLPLL